jgi:hypothetical protein
MGLDRVVINRGLAEGDESVEIGVVERGDCVIHGWASEVAHTTRRIPHSDTAHLALIFSDAQLSTPMGVFERGVEESTKKTTTRPAFGHKPHQHRIGKEARHERGHCRLDVARQRPADNHSHALYLAPRTIITIGQLLLTHKIADDQQALRPD